MSYNVEPYWNGEIENCPTCLRKLENCPCDKKGE